MGARKLLWTALIAGMLAAGGCGGDGVRDSVLRVEVKPRRDIAELQVEVHDDHAHGGDLAEADGDVGGKGGFTDPALGGEHADHQALAAVFHRLCFRAPVAGGEGLAGTFQQNPDLGGVSLRAEDVPDAGAHGVDQERRLDVADQHQAEAGELDVEDLGETQGLLVGDVRADDEDFGLLLVEEGEQFRGASREDVRGDGLDGAAEAVGDGGPQLLVELGAGGEEDEPAHL